MLRREGAKVEEGTFFQEPTLPRFSQMMMLWCIARLVVLGLSSVMDIGVCLPEYF